MITHCFQAQHFAIIICATILHKLQGDKEEVIISKLNNLLLHVQQYCMQQGFFQTQHFCYLNMQQYDMQQGRYNGIYRKMKHNHPFMASIPSNLGF